MNKIYDGSYILLFIAMIVIAIATLGLIASENPYAEIAKECSDRTNKELTGEIEKLSSFDRAVEIAKWLRGNYEIVKREYVMVCLTKDEWKYILNFLQNDSLYSILCYKIKGQIEDREIEDKEATRIRLQKLLEELDK